MATVNTPLAKGISFTSSADTATIKQTISCNLNFPVFIKPANGGSSIGVSKVNNSDQLKNALELGFSFDDELLIEEAFEHQAEVNISCRGAWDGIVELSVAEEVYSQNSFLDFENKYLKGSKSKKSVERQGMAAANRKIPADLTPDMLERILVSAKKAFIATRCFGVVRIDFLVNKQTNQFVLIEINSIPGSLAYYLWEAGNLEFSKLINFMIDSAINRKESQLKFVRTFASKIFKPS